VLLINCEQLELGAESSPSTACVELGAFPEPSPFTARAVKDIKVKKKVLLVYVLFSLCYSS